MNVYTLSSFFSLPEANAGAAFDLNNCSSSHTSILTNVYTLSLFFSLPETNAGAAFFHLFHSSDLVVASPVEDYFIHIDDLPDDKKVCLMVALILSCKMFTLALTWLS